MTSRTDQKPYGIKPQLALIPWEAYAAAREAEPAQRFSDVVSGDASLASLARRLIDDLADESGGQANAIAEIANAYQSGRVKYSLDNWRLTSDSTDSRVEYLSAVQRHLVLRATGEERASDTGVRHLAHAVCGTLMMLSRELGAKPAHGLQVGGKR